MRGVRCAAVGHQGERESRFALNVRGLDHPPLLVRLPAACSVEHRGVADAKRS